MLFACFCLSCANDSDESEEMVIREEFITEELPERRALINFWKTFSKQFNSRDTAAIRSIALDSIWLWGDKVSANEFMQRYYKGYTDSDFFGILDTNKVMYSSIGCHTSQVVKDAVRPEYPDAFNCEQVLIVQDTTGSVVNGIEFSFLQTTKGYLLFGLKYSSSYWSYNSKVDTTTVD